MLRGVAKSRDTKLRGEALDELGSGLFESKQYPEAALALETLYYELPRHPRASGAGRKLNQVRAKLPPLAPMRLETHGLHRAELLMAEERYADAYETLSSLLPRSSRVTAVVDEELVRLKIGICQYHRRQLAAAATTLKKIHRDDLAPEASFYLAETRGTATRASARGRGASRALSEEPWSEDSLQHRGSPRRG
jgi:tetratricopeptide (TPR) repeat protein